MRPMWSGPNSLVILLQGPIRCPTYLFWKNSLWWLKGLWCLTQNLVIWEMDLIGLFSFRHRSGSLLLLNKFSRSCAFNFLISIINVVYLVLIELPIRPSLLFGIRLCRVNWFSGYFFKILYNWLEWGSKIAIVLTNQHKASLAWLRLSGDYCMRKHFCHQTVKLIEGCYRLCSYSMGDLKQSSVFLFGDREEYQWSFSHSRMSFD